jgi:NAD(P)-dependent dehydrogenase (short-subunit alcohol dehydrogenase family)
MLYMEGNNSQMKKVAIVTGSSRGIGAATAKLLALNGYAVCVNHLNEEDKATTIVDEIIHNGGKAIALKADISDETQVVNLFGEVNKLWGPVTALVNNAGINGGTSAVEDVTMECLQNVFSTNVYGTILCCREAVRQMKSNGGGNIVNISSEAARFGGNRITHYAASKAAVSTFTIGFAREVAEFNIRVNAVSPGVIDTDLYAGHSEEQIQQLKKSLPMKRLGSAQEVAESIVWLLSDKASYLSGSIIPIAGGR